MCQGDAYAHTQNLYIRSQWNSTVGKAISQAFKDKGCSSADIEFKLFGSYFSS